MEEHGKARCLLVIEVKHYKRDAPLRFEKVMHVYALAHPSAEIALVAHGPTREVATIGREGWTSRCHALGDLTPLNRPRRDELAQLVSAAVGPPVRPSIKGGARRTALLIDISGSMEEPLASKEFSSWLQTALSTDIAVVALVDTEIRHRCLPQEAERLIGSVANDRGTELEEPIAELLADYGEILLVTDEDGIRALAGNKLAGPPQNLGSGLSVIAIGDPPPVLPTNSAVANMPDGSTTSS
jgi:hypothetical protein